ncbi:MAG: GNAT family N-acetyltransferase [Acutalibacteraceae bacterium]
MMNNMRLVKDYMNNDILRHALNELTEQTFGFNFESWVTNGYFEGDYIPYSFEENGKIISNVSANLMHFIQNGEKRYYIQLGTVMTASDRRKQGLAKKLMEYVIGEYEGKCDGIYLFGDLSALDFYRKLGFEERIQYRYILKDDVRLDIHRKNLLTEHRNEFVKLSSLDIKSKELYCRAVRNSVANGAFEQENKYGLQMFYTSNLENVYYSKGSDCFAVIEQYVDTVELQSVISQKHISLEKIISEINIDYKELKLGFTPNKDDADLFEAVEFNGGDNYRLFCRGSRLKSIEQEKLYFPTFSHA